MFRRTEKGESSIITAIFIALTFIVLMMLFMYCHGGISHNTQINAIARKYLMKMESTGYLTASEQARLIDELEALPYVASVEIHADTSTSFVGHNNDIILHFTCHLNDMPFQAFTNIFRPTMDRNALRQYEVRKSSSYI